MRGSLVILFALCLQAYAEGERCISTLKEMREQKEFQVIHPYFVAGGILNESKGSFIHLYAVENGLRAGFFSTVIFGIPFSVDSKLKFCLVGNKLEVRAWSVDDDFTDSYRSRIVTFYPDGKLVFGEKSESMTFAVKAPTEDLVDAHSELKGFVIKHISKNVGTQLN